MWPVILAWMQAPVGPYTCRAMLRAGPRSTGRTERFSRRSPPKPFLRGLLRTETFAGSDQGRNPVHRIGQKLSTPWWRRGPDVWTNEGARRGGSPPTSRWGGYGGILINRYSENGDSLQATFLAGPVDDLFDAPGYILGLGGDDFGNMYAAGHYIDTLRLSPAHVLVPRERGPYIYQYVFLAGYSPEGSVRWVHGMAGSSEGLRGNHSDRINGYKEPAKPSFDVDAQGNTYLGGFFRKGTVFAAGQPDSVRLEESGAIVVSYDVAGRLRWLRTGGDLGVRADWPSLRPDKMAIPWSLTVSDDGELALGWTVPYGRDGIHVTVGDTAFWSGSGSSGYFELITRHAPDGSLRWVRRLTTNGYVELTEIAMARQGHVYVGGLYDGHWGSD